MISLNLCSVMCYRCKIKETKFYVKNDGYERVEGEKKGGGYLKKDKKKEHGYMKQIISNSREIPDWGQEISVLFLLCFKHLLLGHISFFFNF